jgi:hypothetical protein
MHAMRPTSMTVLRRHTPSDHALARRKLPGWLWFIALWCGGVAAAVSLGFVFKLFMNATLFAVTR